MAHQLLAVALALALATTIGCSAAGESPGSSASSGDSPTTSLIIDAGQNGVVMTCDGPTRVVGVDAAGSRLWQVRADSYDVEPGNPPGALVVTGISRDILGEPGPCDVHAFDTSGSPLFVRRYADSEISPLFTSGNRQVLIERTGNRCILRVFEESKESFLRLTAGGDVSGWAISRDGQTLATLQELDGSYGLSWIVMPSGERPRIVRASIVSNPCVSLSPDGTLAVLGGFRPRLVPFGASRGQRLPLNFVGEVRWSASRILLMRGRGTASGLETTLVLLDRQLAVQSRTTLSGDVVHTDPGFTCAASTDREQFKAQIVSLADGRVATVEGVSDLAPVSASTVVCVTLDGRVEYRENPLWP